MFSSSRGIETLTFVFTDLESSTRLWEEFPEAMEGAVERHDAILRSAVESGRGRVVKLTGDGLLAVFDSPADGAEACLEAQRALEDESWGETGPLRVRMGMHAGEAQPRGGDFYGPSVNRTARIMAAAHGGQVLLSELAAGLAGERLPPDAVLRDLGEHRLKDLSRPERIYQLMHPSLSSEFPPLATLGRRPHNLPTLASEFLGREAQLAAVRDLLETTGVRLVTLTGPGGIGKTRLALQAAADQIDRFEDGVYFVDLSPVRQPDGVFEAVSRAMGLTGASNERWLDSLKQELSSRCALLLLDNFEQVMEAADGVADLLRQCSDLKVLVTSREALRVRGEHLLSVPPLSLPNGRATLISADAASEYEAVRLFVERAREARPGFALVDDNAVTVAEITSRLDGLPLAIELAAARLTLFSPEDLRERLGSRLDLLGRGPRDLPARQQTLRSTIEWSYDLLTADERAILRLLSVFSPTRVEAVEEVAGRLGSLGGVDVVEGLASLVDKSLVDSSEGRLSMLGTIREYAAERLEQEPGSGGAERRAHAEYFSHFAHARRDRLYGSDRDATLDELESELGNILAAWQHWLGARDLGRLEALLDGLWVLHDARGWYHGAVELTNDLLGVLAAVPSTPELAGDEITLRTSVARGLLALHGYTQQVEEAYLAALARSRETGELPRVFPVLRSLATFNQYRGEFGKAEAVGRELLEIAEQQEDESLQVEGLLVLGSSLAFGGDIPTGLEHLDRAVALFDPARHQRGPLRLGPSSGVTSHTTSALILWLVGDPERSAERAARALGLAKRLNHPYTSAYTLFHVGLLDLWRREARLAFERSCGVLDVAEQHDYGIWSALGVTLQGAATAALGDGAEGAALIDRGIAMCGEIGTPPVFWPLLLSLQAGAAALGGHSAEGLRLIREATQAVGESAIQVPDFALVEGDILLAAGDVEGAAACFAKAFEVAGSSGLRLPQLRAATRLTRLGRQPTEALRRVLDTFTGGLELPDLVEAQAVLDDVDARVR